MPGAGVGRPPRMGGVDHGHRALRGTPARRPGTARPGRHRRTATSVSSPFTAPSPPARQPSCQRWGTMSAVDVVRTPDERFAELPGFPFAPRYATLPDGLRMHYVDEGPAGTPRPSCCCTASRRGPTCTAPWSPGWRRAGCGPSHPTWSGSAARTSRWRAPPTRYAAHVDWMAQFVDALGSAPTSRSSSRTGAAPSDSGCSAPGPGWSAGVVAANTALHTAEAGAGRAAGLGLPRQRGRDRHRRPDAARLPAPDPGAHAVPAQPLRAGGHRVGGPRRRPGGLRRPVPRRGVLRGTAPAAAAHGPHARRANAHG